MAFKTKTNPHVNNKNLPKIEVESALVLDFWSWGFSQESAKMAEHVQAGLEGMLMELQQLQRVEILSPDEVKWVQ